MMRVVCTGGAVWYQMMIGLQEVTKDLFIIVSPDGMSFFVCWSGLPGKTK